MIEIYLIILVINLIKWSDELVVPPTSPTRHQLILGLGVPLNLENEAVTYGWTVKAQYFLPESTAEQLKWPYFPGVWSNYNGLLTPPKNLTKTALNTVSQYVETRWKPFPNGGRRKREILIDKLSGQKYEKYDVEVKEVGNVELKINNLYDDEEDEMFDDYIDNQGNKPKLSDYPLKTKEELMDTSGTRWLLYDGFGKMLTAKGLEGRYCVLRSICEAAESNFGFHNGLFGQLFHLFFTPSSTSDVIVNKEHYDYLKAEMLGEAGKPCDQIFHQCKRSVLEIFTKSYDMDFKIDK
ncbi:hypothetical protein ACKWTF_011056 [Chironomus riparius]